MPVAEEEPYSRVFLFCFGCSIEFKGREEEVALYGLLDQEVKSQFLKKFMIDQKDPESLKIRLGDWTTIWSEKSVSA